MYAARCLRVLDFLIGLANTLAAFRGSCTLYGATVSCVPVFLSTVPPSLTHTCSLALKRVDFSSRVRWQNAKFSSGRIVCGSPRVQDSPDNSP